MQVTVQDAMSTEVVTIVRSRTVSEAERLLFARRAEELYVVDAADRIVGILPDYELLKHRLADVSKADATVEDLMTRRFLVVSPQTPLTVAARYLRECFHRRLAVVQERHVIGQISRIDVLGCLSEMPSTDPPPPKFLASSVSGKGVRPPTAG